MANRARRALAALALASAGLLAGLFPGAPTASAAGPRTYRNPVIGADFPDPDVLRAGGAYFAYATTPVANRNRGVFPILRSRDLVHWRRAGYAFAKPPRWATTDLWAPSVVFWRGTYYLFHVGRSRAGLHCIGVATARRPTGPFRDRGALACRDAKTLGYIDPEALVARDGRVYLYLSVDAPAHRIAVMPLGRDLLHPAPIRPLFGISQRWEIGRRFATVEGPAPLERDGRYYLFYSGNDWNSADYGMGYATARSPLGPFVKSRANPILHRTTKVLGPGGGSVIDGPDGRDWLTYHAWQGGPGYDAGGVRSTRIDRLVWHGREPLVRGPTTGVHLAP